jgi:hypothetical protein
MPKRTDLQSILILGSGPIVIGQAAEFDYSGTQPSCGLAGGIILESVHLVTNCGMARRNCAR